MYVYNITTQKKNLVSKFLELLLHKNPDREETKIELYKTNTNKIARNGIQSMAKKLHKKKKEKGGEND